MTSKKISFIGTGKMATALISSFYNKQLAKTIIASDKNNKNLNNVKKNFGIKTIKDNKEAVRNSDVVFICVKPQDFDEVLHEIKNVVKNQLIVSIAAGIKTKHIESILGNKRIIRVMPNINCLVGEMAAGFSKGKFATKKDVDYVEKLLSASGLAYLVKEDLMDALSIISGCGPGFFAYFMKYLAEAGIKEGLPKQMAYKLAAKTALGTGKLLLEKNMSPDDLIAMVASKKGITSEGLKVLNKHKVNKIIQKTSDAAYKRSKELGK